MKKNHVLSILIFSIILSFMAGLAAAEIVKRTKKIQSCSSSFTLINPNIDCNPSYPIKKHEYGIFRGTLEKFILSQKKEGKAFDISVYFRDLYNGPTFGIDERLSYAPASLLKLPLAFAVLKLADDNIQFLRHNLLYKRIEDGHADLEQFFVPKESIEQGKSYNIEELLRRMIVYSDNDAYDVLFTFLKDTKGSSVLLETFRELGIIYTDLPLENTMTAKSYASLFRLLYQASYVSSELSQKLLEMLAKSDFNAGLSAGVSDNRNIAVAHKFGERWDSETGVKQLHDCGIVYFPDNPYLLCVMTRGNDFDKLADVISTISKMVYTEVYSRKTK